MSGAASNSAARRRRGGTQAPAPQNTQQRPGQGGSRLPQVEERDNKPVNPMELLLMHDRKLYGIEQYLEKATHGLASSDDVEGMGENVITSNVVSSSLVSSVALLNERVDRLEDSAPTFNNASASMSGSNLDASRIEKMETEIVDLKKLLLKIQTFSMETNLTLMKVKERQQIYSKLDKSSIVDTDIKDEVKTEIDSMAATDDAVNIVSSEETNDSVGITFSRTEKLNV